MKSFVSSTYAALISVNLNFEWERNSWAVSADWRAFRSEEMQVWSLGFRSKRENVEGHLLLIEGLQGCRGAPLLCVYWNRERDIPVLYPPQTTRSYGEMLASEQEVWPCCKTKAVPSVFCGQRSEVCEDCGWDQRKRGHGGRCCAIGLGCFENLFLCNIAAARLDNSEMYAYGLVRDGPLLLLDSSAVLMPDATFR